MVGKHDDQPAYRINATKEETANRRQQALLRVKMPVMLPGDNPETLRGDTAEVSPRLVGERAAHDFSAPPLVGVARAPGVTKAPPMVATRANTATFIVREFDI